MKIIRWLSNWGSLYILVGIFLAALYWVQKLNIKSGDDEILSIGMLVGFGFLLNSWINHHERDFLDSEMEEFWVERENYECHQASYNHPEKMN